MTTQKYGIRSLKRDFPDDASCLNFMFDALHTRECSCGGIYAPMFKMFDGKFYGRRQFQCSNCRSQIAPMVGTIFEKSSTDLTLWFHAVLVFSNAKSGISAKELARQLEVTYKTAWRMLHFIKKALPKNDGKLRGDVEIDTGYFGGKGYGGKNNKYQAQVMAKKSVVIVAVERGGRMRAEVVANTGAPITRDFVERNIEKKATTLYTDSYDGYKGLDKSYDRSSVVHKRKEWVRGETHINTVETFFAHIKRSIGGTHKSISKQHLAEYLSAFVWHWNNRHSDKDRFSGLLGGVLRASR